MLKRLLTSIGLILVITIIASPAMAAGGKGAGYHARIAAMCSEGEPCMLIPPPPPAKPGEDLDTTIKTKPGTTLRLGRDSGRVTEGDRRGAATLWWQEMGMGQPADNGQDWEGGGYEGDRGVSRSGSYSGGGGERSVGRSAPAQRSAPSSPAPSSSPSSPPSGPDCR